MISYPLHNHSRLPVILITLIIYTIRSVSHQTQQQNEALTTVTNFRLPRRKRTRQRTSQACIRAGRSRAARASRCARRLLSRNCCCTAISLLSVRNLLQPRATADICEKTVASGRSDLGQWRGTARRWRRPGGRRRTAGISGWHRWRGRRAGAWGHRWRRWRCAGVWHGRRRRRRRCPSVWHGRRRWNRPSWHGRRRWDRGCRWKRWGNRR